MHLFFAPPLHFQPHSRCQFSVTPFAPTLPLPHRPCPRPTSPPIPPVQALLSVPFPLPDPFAFPSIAFPNSTASSDFRPELAGSLLWTVGLYFGFSEKRRWGSAALNLLTSLLTSLGLPPDPSDAIATATHTLPFLFLGFTIDALLRNANGGSAVWALASGLSVAMYGAIYELGRRSATGKRVADSEEHVYTLFDDFAERRLEPRGMCHLVDVRAAVRNDPKARRLQTLSDERLRRFMRNRFPKARRSPNGFYRGVSVRQVSEKPAVTSSFADSDGSPK